MTDIERYNKDRATVMSMVKFILMLAIIAALIFVGTRLVVILVPFIIGFLLARTSFAIATPIAKKVSKPSKHKTVLRKIATFIYVILLLVIAALVVWCCSALVGQVFKVINNLSNMADGFDPSGLSTEFIHKMSGVLSPAAIQSIEDALNDAIKMFIGKVPAILTGILTSIWTMIGNLPYGIFVVICVILSGYYFINDGPNVLKAYLKTIPNKSFRMKSVSLLNDLSVTLFRALGGYVALLIITAVEAWVAFTIADVNYAIILALVTAVIDFLPVLGISATMIPAMIYLALHNNYRGIIILVIAMAIMTVIRRIIEPAILGKSLHLHPLLMLLGMALGVYIWGAIGFLLGPTVLIIIMDIFHVFKIDKKISSFLSHVLSNFMKDPDEIKEAEKAN